VSPPLRAFISTQTDPHLNFAIENSLLESVSEGDRILFLYRNRDSVVIGRHQNPWIECDLKLMRRDGVLLARRQSGGGAVFHDLGNTNYSLLSSRADYDEDRGFAVVLNALRDLGLDVERNERNDLVYRGRKFSGSAFRHRRGRSFQHGTLLVAADLDRLTRYLSAPSRRIAAKGTASVRSGVVNLSQIRADVDHEQICRAVVESFGREYGAAESALISEADVTEEAYRAAHELRSWEWLFGKSPDFRHELAISPAPPTTAGRSISATFTVHRGVVRSVETVPAATSPSTPADVRERTTRAMLNGGPSRTDVVAALDSLIGCRYESTELCRCLAGRAPRQTAALLCKMLEEEIP
jgi:lipoate-protein ligase A